MKINVNVLLKVLDFLKSKDIIDDHSMIDAKDVRFETSNENNQYLVYYTSKLMRNGLAGAMLIRTEYPRPMLPVPHPEELPMGIVMNIGNFSETLAYLKGLNYIDNDTNINSDIIIEAWDEIHLTMNTIYFYNNCRDKQTALTIKHTKVRINELLDERYYSFNETDGSIMDQII